MGPNQQARLDRVNQRLTERYGQRPGSHRLPTLTLANLVGSSGRAELTGPAVKAANTRAAAPFFAELAGAIFTGSSPLDRAVCEATSKLSDLYHVFAARPMFLETGDLQLVDTIVKDFGIACQYLRNWAEENHHLYWQIRPKHHKAMHLPYFATIANPRFVSCYSDESQVGTSTR
eukprot:2721904-Alexandrium_andersonii.AAC.1